MLFLKRANEGPFGSTFDPRNLNKKIKIYQESMPALFLRKMSCSVISIAEKASVGRTCRR